MLWAFLAIPFACLALGLYLYVEACLLGWLLDRLVLRIARPHRQPIRARGRTAATTLELAETTYIDALPAAAPRVVA